MNKRKIFNDPVYGFINIQNDLIFDIIQHPFFQRLRRIKQLGLTDLIYPGALHTRFHHAIGAMHLMERALNTLRSKGHMIFEAEYEAAMIAILLHDIGHGPFSHTLEFSLLKNVNHEEISKVAIRRLNQEFDGRLDLAIEIFEGKYPRKFLTQLVSSQLDIDRLDYLQRDCFFTGVHEGTIGAERIIKMLNVVDDELVVEEKAIYNIENFLNARRLMYWQVYFHKTAIGVEQLLIKVIKRAKKMSKTGSLFATPALSFFLEREISVEDLKTKNELLDQFMTLDDTDIWGSMKFWESHDDFALRELCRMLLSRRLFKVKILNEKVENQDYEKLITSVSNQYGIQENDAKYFVQRGSVNNKAYALKGESIKVEMKNGSVQDITDVMDLPNIRAMSKIVRKYYLCWPKNVSLPD